MSSAQANNIELDDLFSESNGALMDERNSELSAQLASTQQQIHDLKNSLDAVVAERDSLAAEVNLVQFLYRYWISSIL